MRTSLRPISAKASSQTNTPSSTRTGISATPQCRHSVSSQAIGSHDLQRREPFGLAVMAVAPAARGAYRQDHRQPQGDGEVEVELRPKVGIMMRRAVRL